MKLTEKQREIVEKNHNLIYWIAHMKNLDLEEWYDLLAIELCLTIPSYDDTKGSLSNYYKVRCDNLIMKEYKKQRRQKRSHNGLLPMDREYPVEENLDFHIYMNEILDDENSTIIKLRVDGYTQSEIAEILGVSQSHVSKVINKIRSKYER